MSKLLKSKFLLGLVVVAAFAFLASSADAAITSTLRLGSRSAQVMELQQNLNAAGFTVSTSGAGSVGSETTYFGSKTKAAVMAWQASKGLSADGVFGPMSRAAWASGSAMTYPAGCTSAVGYSSTTGLPCSSGSVMTYPAGCTSAVGYSSTTGLPCSSGTVVSQTGPVSAMLSADNPASGTIVAGQATADLLHVTFTGSGTVNSLTFTRSGVSNQNTLSNIYVYDGVQRLTDGYSFNTNSTFTVNNLGLVVNGSKTISVKADVLSTSTDYDIIVTLSSFTVGTSVNTVNIKGNDMFIAGGGSLATINKDSTGTATGATGGNTVASATVNAGTSSYTVWRQAVQVNTRALWLKAANFRVTGSAPSDALQNVGFYVDGVKAGSNATLTMTNSSNYLSFDMAAAPVSLSTGTHTFEVRGDVVKGSSYNLSVSLQQASDIMVYDPQIGVNLAMGGTLSGASFTASQAGTISIGTGSYTSVVDPTFNSLSNVTAGASNVTIAKFKLHGYGEDVKVTSLPITTVMTFPSSAYSSGTVTTGSQSITVASTSGFAVGNVVSIPGATAAVGTVTSITSSTVMVVNITTGGVTPSGTVVLVPTALGLQNVTAYFNGSQIGTQQSQTVAGLLTYTLGSQMIIPAGVDSYLEIKADLRTGSAGTNYNGGTVAANLGAATAEGVTSKAAITGPTTTGNVLSLQSGTLALSKNAGFLNKNANPNNTGVKIGSYVLQNQSTSESIRVTTLAVKVAYGSATSSSNLSGLRTSETSGNAGTPVQPATAAASSNATNTFSSDFTLAPGAVKTIDVLADSGSDSDATNATVITSLTVTSIGTTSNVSATSSLTVGQTVTFTVGTITNSSSSPSLVTSSSTAAQLVPAANGGATNATKATFNFASTGGASTISELKFTIAGATTGTSVSVNSISAPFVSGVAYLTGLSLVVPLGGSGLNLDVYVSYPEVGISGIISTTTSAVSLTYFKYTSGGTTTTVSSPSTTVGTAPTMVLVGSKPAYTVTDSADSLSNGQRKLAEVTVSADAKGDIKLGKLAINVTSTGVASIATGTDNIVVKDANDVVVVTKNPTFAVAASGSSGAVSICFDTTTAACASGNSAANGYLIPAGTSKTFRIYATAATVSGAVNTTSLSTVLGTNTSTTWYDVAGNNTTAIDASNVFNYPTTTSVITN